MNETQKHKRASERAAFADHVYDASEPLKWGAFDASGRLRAAFDSEREAYFYIRNRGHMHNGSHREIDNQ